LKSVIDRKEENSVTVEGEFNVKRHIIFERTIKTFNSRRVEFGEWRVANKIEVKERIPPLSSSKGSSDKDILIPLIGLGTIVVSKCVIM